MAKKRKVKKTVRKQEVDVKTSTKNLLLNIAIFILGVVIIYMSISLFHKLYNPYKDDPIAAKEIPSEIIQVEVLNGCGVSGVADRYTDFLRAQKFDVVNVGNYISFDVDKTMVIDRIGNEANARKVAESLGVSEENVFQQLNEDYFLDVSIIVGKDYNKLKPLK